MVVEIEWMSAVSDMNCEEYQKNRKEHSASKGEMRSSLRCSEKVSVFPLPWIQMFLVLCVCWWRLSCFERNWSVLPTTCHVYLQRAFWRPSLSWRCSGFCHKKKNEHFIRVPVEELYSLSLTLSTFSIVACILSNFHPLSMRYLSIGTTCHKLLVHCNIQQCLIHRRGSLNLKWNYEIIAVRVSE